MGAEGLNWDAYLGGIAAFAGTLFALVLAARQIRGPVDEEVAPEVIRAYFLDSIAVTVELGMAALLAVLVTIEKSLLFSIATCALAVVGAALSLTSAVGWWLALGELKDGWRKAAAWGQGLGNILPLACYGVAVFYALSVFRFDEAAWGYAAVVSWLTFSGAVQSVLWYARIWAKPSLASVERALKPNDERAAAGR